MFIPHIDISTLSFSSTTMHLFELYEKSKSQHIQQELNNSSQNHLLIANT